MTRLATRTADTAPKDGRVYRGYFERSAPKGTMLKAVRWMDGRGWVDLTDQEIGDGWRLSAWSPD